MLFIFVIVEELVLIFSMLNNFDLFPVNWIYLLNLSRLNHSILSSLVLSSSMAPSRSSFQSGVCPSGLYSKVRCLWPIILAEVNQFWTNYFSLYLFDFYLSPSKISLYSEPILVSNPYFDFYLIFPSLLCIDYKNSCGFSTMPISLLL